AVRVITPDFRQSDAVDNGAGARSFGGSQDGLSSIIGLTDEGASFVAPSDQGVGGRSIGEGANPVDLVPTLFNYGEKHRVEGRGIRLSPAQSGARSFERPDSAEDFDVAPADSTLDGVNVVGARIIRKSPEGRSQDVYVQELATKASQGVLVRTMVRRYRRDDGGLKFASVAPLGENQFGRNAVASDMDFAYQLLPLADEPGKIARLQLIKIPFRSATPEALRTLSFPRPKIDRLSDQDAARRKRQQVCATADPLTTSQEAVYHQVLNAGRAYSTMPWRVTERSKGPDSCPNSSAPGFAKAPQIAVANVGDTLRGMPYGWGNFDSVDSFRRRVERQGIRAGNVCTNSGGGIPGSTAGIDCSGFVQRALNLPHQGKLGTSTMQPYMIDLGTFAALRPGDVLLKPGSHVMFYLGMTNGGIWTAESTTSCNRQRTHRGVCFVTRSFDFMSGYRPARPVTNCSK
ncbi:MAG TPA: hypothetical protein DCL54_19260, partial [Alphaproteobacteria bacterium]|nr:hypothetical protein [Alphaproteobacteria bacterium]